MFRKNLSLLALAALAIAMVFSGCQADTGANTVKIGWFYALTGDDAVWGQCELQTLQMLVAEQNAKGGILGKQIELIPYDNRADSEESVKVVKRLVSMDRVVAILGPGTSGSALPVADILTEFKVPDIATVATNPKVTVLDGKLKPYNFRVCFIDPYQGAVAAGFAFDKLGARKAAIIYDTGMDYSQGLAQFFEESFVAMGGQIVAKEGFKSGDVDFRAQLTKIKAANPDIIFMPYYYTEVALTANQARELGITQVMLGGDGWPSDELLKMAGPALEGCYFINHVDYEDPVVQDFRQKYQAKYGKASEINGYLMYDAFYVLMDAITRAGKADGASIAAALETTDMMGITGRVRIGKDTHNPEGKEAAIIKIIDGKYVFQQKYAPTK